MVKVEFSIPIPMRDGVKLSNIILKPEENGIFPCFLLRTPYSSKKMFSSAKLVSKQFNSVVIMQDCRGRYDSEGIFRVFEEKEDTLDTIDWIEKQKWFNGDLNIFGPSYLGYVGLQVLDEDKVNIRTIFAPKVLGNVKDSIHRGDVLQFHWALPWSIMTSTRVQSSLTLINGTWPEAYNIAYQDKIENAVKNFGWPDEIWRLFLTPLNSDVWKKYDLKGVKTVNPRICLVGGWYDFLLNATLNTYDDLMKRGGKKPDFIIGPWSHNGYLASQAGIETWDFGKEGKGNFVKDMAEFIEREKNKAPQLIKTFILRKNVWMELDTWPSSQIKKKKLFLNRNETLSDNEPEVELELEIEIDMNNPVPTLGGIVWESYEPVEPGPTDQSPLQDRQDILRFYTKDLEKDLILLGPVLVELWVKFNLPEAHFTAKLVVVEEDEKERIFQDGILRVLGPMDKYSKISIDLLSTGIEIRKGERLGLEISWSNFPKYSLPPIDISTKQMILISKNTPSNLEMSILE